MRNLYKITNIALIFTLIGVFLCQDIYALRVPVGLDKTRKRYKVHEEQDIFIREINEAKIKLGIKKGEKVGVEVLALEMGYETRIAFMRKANIVRLDVRNLRSLGIIGIKSSRTKNWSIKELIESIAVKEKEGVLRSEIIDAIKEVSLIIAGMTQGNLVKYGRVEDIQDNIDDVIKGIFEDIMRDRARSILNNAVNCLEADDDEDQLQWMKEIAQGMNEIAGTINEHIFNYSDDKLMRVIARFPRYSLQDRDKIEGDIRNRVELGEDANFLERIQGHIEIEGNEILRKIGGLNEVVKEIEDNLKEGTKKDKVMTADYEDAKKLRKLCEKRIDEFTPSLIISVSILLAVANKEQRKSILERLGVIQYPEEDVLLFNKARELLDEANEPAPFIREAKKKIAFCKAVCIKLSDFTFFSQAEYNMMFPEEKRERIDDCMDIIEVTSDGLLQMIKEYEQGQVILKASKRNRIEECIEIIRYASRRLLQIINKELKSSQTILRDFKRNRKDL